MGADVVALLGHLSHLLVEFENTGEFAGSIAPAAEGGADGFVLGAYPANVNHSAEP
jgi:hypothetical protein